MISLNIGSLPKHGGELLVFLEALEINFHIIVLSEIGARNIGIVEHLLPYHDFHYVLPRDNYFEGVGIYIHKDIFGFQIMDELSIQKSCRCSKCVIESLFIKCTYCSKSYILGGINRHPNGNINHFLTDLENALRKIDGTYTAIISGDINIDLMKYNLEDNYQYVSTIMSYGYLPYITLPTRITDFSATCIGHIFIRDTSKYREIHTEIFSGILYPDITDHLPCFVRLTCSNVVEDERPIVRLYGEKNTLKFKELMINETRDDLYTEGTDWYDKYIK